MIISKKIILDEINKKSIEIICHYYESDTGEDFFTKKLNCKNLTDNSTRDQFLERQIEGSRISLTLGPLLHLIDAEDSVPDSIKYHGHENIIDLTKKETGYQYLLKPLKSVVILTNEYVKLSSSYMGFIISRVNNNSLGLNVKSSYVSSNWEGILKITIRNESSSSFPLTHGMDIAALFICEVKNPNAPDNVSDVIQASHHGLTWQSVFNRNENPFTSSSIKADNISNGLIRNILKKKVDWGVDIALLTIIGGIIYGFVGMKNKLDTLLSERNQLQNLKVEVDEIQSSFVSKSHKSGISTITVRKGTKEGVLEEKIKGAISSSHYIMTQPVNSKNQVSSTNGSVAGSSERQKLKIKVILNKPSKNNLTVDVRWIIFP